LGRFVFHANSALVIDIARRMFMYVLDTFADVFLSAASEFAALAAEGDLHA
jgi:hypothetical protein